MSYVRGKTTERGRAREEKIEETETATQYITRKGGSIGRAGSRKNESEEGYRERLPLFLKIIEGGSLT